MGESKSSFHPALTVNNIKSSIPVVLEFDNSQYFTWAELFKLHARSKGALDHIIPPKSTDDGKETTPLTAAAKELWSTLDAAIVGWIYSTISNDLLQTIMEPDATTMEVWARLRDIFQDNQNSRAVTLEQEFSSTKMEDFPNVSAYCQRLKGLSDQLRNVGAPVDNNRLVLQLVSGLTEAYKGVGTLIRQSSPLPLFYQARSMLTLEEAGLMKQAALSSASAMVVTSRDSDDGYDNSGGSRGRNNSPKTSGGRKQNGGKAGKSGGKGGKTGGTGGRGGAGQQPQQQPPPHWQQQQWPQKQQWPQFPGWVWAPQWAAPPCPYPNQGWARPQGPTRQSGILGPRPHQAYAASNQSGQYTPTDIESAMHTMTLSQPDPSWYMDTRATSHMTSSNGNLSSYFNLSNHPNNIVVGSGHTIPILGCGRTTLSSPHPPLSLHSVLHAPKLIKNLISVRKFTVDNNVTVEFDPYGFFVKDYRTGMPIMRCNSTPLPPIFPLPRVLQL
ncbi:uncharacterized protein LOC110689129 [Chenopodium quinoa]|uniref:uncharacterized protein LOC110689129 n=1 Tax=Chenopodium quinoa TaxID=63459 RepID=UPI000B76E543|nr:uncharacterized protein LOC110689129 [Chenopodium quinoa]